MSEKSQWNSRFLWRKIKNYYALGTEGGLEETIRIFLNAND